MRTPPNTLRGRACIGFIRVSTNKQKTEGLSLEQQIETIRAVVAERGGDLLTIRGDVASGMGVDAHRRNPELFEALKEARDKRAAIVVTDITRLGRSDTLAKAIRQFELEVFSADTGRILTYDELERRLRSAQAFGEALRRRVVASLSKPELRARVGNSKNLRYARERAAIVRLSKANERAEEIAQILSTVDPQRKLSAAQVAVLLNGRGLRTSRGNIWTKEPSVGSSGE